MKNLVYALTVLLASGALGQAQTRATGTWRAEGPGAAFPWEVVLRADGTAVTGIVSNCVPGRVGIHEGRIDGNTITFRCTGGNGLRTMTFTGRLNGDEIAFSWVRDGPPSPLGDWIFGAAPPPSFLAKRVPDGDLAKSAEVLGSEFAAVLNLVPKDMTLRGTLFVPQRVRRVRAVILVIRWGSGGLFFPSSEVRRVVEATGAALLLAEFATISTPIHNIPRYDGADALLLLLQRLAQESGHQELTGAPLLFWGHSAAGAVGPAFAALHPERTIAFVRYHSGGGISVDPKALRQVPALFLKGGKDTQVLGDAEELWRSGRSLGAPWTFSLDPEATHGGEEAFRRASDLMIPWITAVLRQRLPPDGASLRAVSDTSAWMGNNQTGEVARCSTFLGSKLEESWLPDEPSAGDGGLSLAQQSENSLVENEP